MPGIARPLLVPVLGVLVGCYTYVPASLDSVPVGAHLRALVSPTAETQLHSTFGVPGSYLDGRLVARSPDTLTLYTLSVPGGSELRSQPLFQQVPVQRADVLRVDVRRMDSFRTGVLVAVAAAAVGAVVFEAVGGISGSSGPGPGGGPSERLQAWNLGWAIPLP